MSDRIKRYLPPHYQEILDFEKLSETEGIELESLIATMDQLFEDQFVATSSTKAVSRRERMLGIQADPQTESLEFRKLRILNRYQTKPPFTIRYLQQQLDFLVGPGRALAEFDDQTFILTITTSIDDANIFREVQHTLKTIKPANMIYQQNTALQDNIVLNERIVKREITWNYKLGEWSLGEKSFATFEPEEVVK